MSPLKIAWLATGAVVFVFLGVRGLAAAQFGLSGPGTAEAPLTDGGARVQQGSALAERNCNLCRAVSMACDSCKNKAPPFRNLHARHPSLELREPLSRSITAPDDEKLRFILSEVEIHSIVASSNSPATSESGSTTKTRTPAVTDCHNVLRTDAASPNRRAPAFKKVANTPGMSITALTVWSRTTHPSMPNLVIEPADMDDLIAYILSLRDR
jgi:hypothetical protein